MLALTVSLLALFSLLYIHLGFCVIYGWCYQAPTAGWILHCGNISFLAALNLQSSISPKEGNQKDSILPKCNHPGNLSFELIPVLTRVCASHNTKSIPRSTGMQVLVREIGGLEKVKRDWDGDYVKDNSLCTSVSESSLSQNSCI